MGLSLLKLKLKNPKLYYLEAIEVDCLADTGVLHLCIPEHIQVQLKLNEIEQKEVILLDGNRKLVSYAWPLELKFRNRTGFAGALVMGDQVLLGAIPMEDIDLNIIPKTRTIDINPDNTNIEGSILKSYN